jgi:RHS repeat-associated protein
MTVAVAFIAIAAVWTSRAQAQTPQPAADDKRMVHAQPFTGPYQWTGGRYTYDPAGNVIGIDEQSFRYDATGRLVSASVLSPDESPSPNYYSSRAYQYDVYGNLTSKTADGVVTNIAVDPNSNRLNGTGAAYDAAGNLTNLTYAGYQHVYAYDALSSQKSETVTNLSGSPTVYHVYSPSDERLLVADTGTNMNTWTVRDLGGNPIRQIENNTSTSTWVVRRDYAYRDGVLLEANVAAESRQEHYTLDHLSTPRLVTNASAQAVGYHVYLPFGEEWFPPSSSTQEGSPKKFTGQERDRDLASYAADPFSLDYMHARFYSNPYGRFLSVDPMETYDGTPQSWNRYAYGMNNPLSYVDPDGRCSFTLTDGSKYVDSNTDCTEVTAPHWTSDDLGGIADDEFAQDEAFFNELADRVKSVWDSVPMKDFRNEFKDGGCVNVFGKATADALNPFTPSLATAAEPATYWMAARQYNGILTYAAGRENFLGGIGLIYPMKSGVVRKLLGNVNMTLGASALANLDLAIIQGLIAEGKAIATGECQ